MLFSVKSNELLALLVILALGFAAGFIVRGRLRRRSQPAAEPPRSSPLQEATPAREPPSRRRVASLAPNRARGGS